MSTLKLISDPTFKASVSIPVPGKGAVPVEFEFKHRTVSALNAFLADGKDIPDVDYVLSIASGWEFTDPFTKKNVATLLDSYAGAARAIARTYIEELTGQKLEPEE